jgi:arylsulfatase
MATLAVGIIVWLAPHLWRKPEGYHAIVLITLDTTRGDRFDWDDPRALPFLKSLFARGLRFTQAVTTAPVTGPAHATILSGLPPTRHGVLTNLNPLPVALTTLAEQLQALGFRTAAFVSCSVLDAGRGFEQGFEHYDAEFQRAYAGRYYERTADATTASALAWLRQNDGDPFFLWLHYFDPHAPYDPPRLHRPRGFADLERRRDVFPSVTRLQRIHRDRIVLDRRLIEFYRELYASEIEFVDAQVGRLVSYLGSRSYFDRTIFVLTADHGEELADHGSYFEHSLSLYDGVMRVPLALRVPGGPTGVVPTQVTNGSVFATILGLLGEPIPPEIYPSLLAAHGRPSTEATDGHVCIKEPHPAVKPWGVALRVPPWKYLYWEDGRGELYDVAHDPQEHIDRTARHPRISTAMRARIRREVVVPLASIERRADTEVVPDDETRRMLERLGYLESSR